jgi:hypothetical protein
MRRALEIRQVEVIVNVNAFAVLIRLKLVGLVASGLLLPRTPTLQNSRSL